MREKLREGFWQINAVLPQNPFPLSGPTFWPAECNKSSAASKKIFKLFGLNCFFAKPFRKGFCKDPA
ncbi:MAG: hypothetical protein EBT68_03040 [Verrucomicrobia bacterium]|nr:hypothetical protein [Verrucomicrobiota bacterium]